MGNNETSDDYYSQALMNIRRTRRRLLILLLAFFPTVTIVTIPVQILDGPTGDVVGAGVGLVLMYLIFKGILDLLYLKCPMCMSRFFGAGLVYANPFRQSCVHCGATLPRT